LGTALAIKMIAFVLLAPIAGGFAPPVPRRMFPISLDVLRAAIVLYLPFVSEIWQIYVLIFLLQACSAGFTPVFQATIPDILENEDEYIKALSLSRFAYDVESLISPAIAGAALLLIGFNALFVANAFAICISALLEFYVRLPPKQPASNDISWLNRMTFGVLAYLATPRLRGLLQCLWPFPARVPWSSSTPWSTCGPTLALKMLGQGYCWPRLAPVPWWPPCPCPISLDEWKKNRLR
jgi:hypothetical protein